MHMFPADANYMMYKYAVPTAIETRRRSRVSVAKYDNLVETLTDLPSTSHAMLTKSDRSWSLYSRRSSNEYKSSPAKFAWALYKTITHAI